MDGWELARSVIGPMVGAGLAFASNALVQRGKTEKEDVVAGNLALLTIATRLSDVYLLRADARTAIGTRLTGGPAPIWALAPRTFMTFAATQPMNFNSLAFLLEKKRGAEVFVRIHHLETKYADLQAIAKMCHDTVFDVQKKMSELIARQPKHTWEEAEAHLGLELSSRLNDEFLALLLRVHQHVDYYLATYRDLLAALRDLYGPRIIDIGTAPQKKCSLEELPALPAELAAYIAQPTPESAVVAKAGYF